MALLHNVIVKRKKPGFNDLASPHEGRIQGGLQLRTVEVVFDQLLSAWLGVNRWTNYTHVHTVCTCVTVFRKTRLVLLLAYPKTNHHAASLKQVDQIKWLHRQPPGSWNGSKVRTQTHKHVIRALKAIWRLTVSTPFSLNQYINR